MFVREIRIPEKLFSQMFPNKFAGSVPAPEFICQLALVRARVNIAVNYQERFKGFTIGSIQATIPLYRHFVH